MTQKKSIAQPFGIETLLTAVQFDEKGLIPAVIQDTASKEVLTLCYMNIEAIRKSLEEGMVYVFRRSQNRLMLKGETSGNTQTIKRVTIDCEGKSMLLQVRQNVAACHTGHFTCYFRQLMPNGKMAARGKRVFDPAKVYKKPG